MLYETSSMYDEIFRRIHRDLVPETYDVEKQKEQLDIAAGILNKDATVFVSQASIDELISQLKDERKQLDKWKSENCVFETLNESNPTFQNNPNEKDTIVKELKTEIEFLRKSIKRYQEADPQSDYVYKDTYFQMQNELNQLRAKYQEILTHHDKLVVDLETVKWKNSLLEEETDGYQNKIDSIAKELSDERENVMHKNHEIEKLSDVKSRIEIQFKELQKRYDILDNHLLELGEQKSTFIEGLRERQSKLDYSLAQLKLNEEKIKSLEKDNQILNNDKKQNLINSQNFRDEYEQLQNQLRDCRDKIVEHETTIQQNDGEKIMYQDYFLKLFDIIVTVTNQFEVFVNQSQVKTEDLKSIIYKLHSAKTQLNEAIFLKKKYNTIVANSKNDNSTSKNDNSTKVRKIASIVNAPISLVQEVFLNVPKVDSRKGIEKVPQPVRDSNEENKELKNAYEKITKYKNAHAVLERTISDKRKGIGWATQIKNTEDIKKFTKGFPVNYVIFKKTFFMSKTHVKGGYMKLCPDIKNIVINKFNPQNNNIGSTLQTIQLQKILRIEYGINSDAATLVLDHKLHEDNKKPWLCASIYTPNIAYNFVFPKESFVNIFFLALGTLLPNIPMIRDKRELVYRRALMKIRNYCSKRNISLVNFWLEGIRRYIITTPELGQTYLNKLNNNIQKVIKIEKSTENSTTPKTINLMNPVQLTKIKVPSLKVNIKMVKKFPPQKI